MRMCLLGLCALSLVPTTGFGQKPEPAPVTGKIKWVYDYDAAKIKSATEDKPMFVVIRCER